MREVCFHGYDDLDYVVRIIKKVETKYKVKKMDMFLYYKDGRRLFKCVFNKTGGSNA